MDAFGKVFAHGVDDAVFHRVETAAAHPVAFVVDRYAAVRIILDKFPARFFIGFVAVKVAFNRPFLLVLL